jgi:ABC-type glycerol-3-phosphate transport system substrate-binding protein
MKKILVIAALLFMVLSMGAWANGGGETSGKAPLNLTVYTKWPQSPTYAPTDLTVQKLVSAALAKYVGRPVNFTWISHPPNEDGLVTLQKFEAAGTMPDIYGQDDLLNLPPLWDYATKKNLIKEITVDDFNKYLTGFVNRVKYYGGDINTVLTQNLSPDGKHWFIPFGFQSAGFPKSDKVPDPFWARNAGGFTGGHFRDDILTKIYPTAKTEAQVRDLLLKKKGQLDLTDLADIPIKNWSDLYDYGMKVKALNLQANGKPVIPLAPNFSSEDPMSVYWSLVSATGAWWHLDWDPGTPLDNSTLAPLGPSFKEQVRWFNKMYNAGLMDPEIFIMKNDQYSAKVANGQYAEVNAFFNNMAEAERVGKANGYGWRSVVFWYPMDLTTNANKYSMVSIRDVGVQVGNTKTVNANWADVLKTIDYYFTEASDELAYWGSPDWYTGAGDARRYKPEFKDLENWTVYGKEGGKDGTYYGLGGGAMILNAEGQRTQHATKYFSFWANGGGGAVGNTYPNSPYYVYRRDKGFDFSADYANVDLGGYTNNLFLKKYVSPNTTFTLQGEFSLFVQPFSGPAMTKFSQGVNWSTRGAMLAKVVTGTAGDFDTNWNSYLKYHTDNGYNEALAEYIASLKANWSQATGPVLK